MTVRQYQYNDSSGEELQLDSYQIINRGRNNLLEKLSSQRHPLLFSLLFSSSESKSKWSNTLQYWTKLNWLNTEQEMSIMYVHDVSILCTALGSITHPSINQSTKTNQPTPSPPHQGNKSVIIHCHKRNTWSSESPTRTETLIILRQRWTRRPIIHN